jgi:hypothetical protein
MEEHMKKTVWVLAASLLPLLAGSPASAFTMAQRCVIAYRDCFVMRAPAGGMTPEQRLDRVNERLAYILGYESLRPSSIRTVPQGSAVEIRVGKSLLTTVTPADARANGTRNVMGLAQVWLRNLRAALPEARPKSLIAARPSGDRMARAR